MTTFERDYREAQQGNEIEIILRRRAEIQEMTRKARATKNGFIRQCIAQDIDRLTKELTAIENLF